MLLLMVEHRIMEKGRLLPFGNMVLCICFKCGMVAEVDNFIIWKVK